MGQISFREWGDNSNSVHRTHKGVLRHIPYVLLAGRVSVPTHCFVRRPDTIACSRAVSLATKALNASGDLLNVTTIPYSLALFFTSACPAAIMAAACSLFKIGCGVAAGTNIPIHDPTDSEGTPTSGMVGMSGNAAERADAAIASALIAPDLTCGSTNGAVVITRSR